jgi:hypothetical protein
MVVATETIGRIEQRKQIPRKVAVGLGYVATEIVEVELERDATPQKPPVPAELLAMDGASYDQLTAAHWRQVAMRAEPDLYLDHAYEAKIVPFSEEALGDKF